MSVRPPPLEPETLQRLLQTTTTDPPVSFAPLRQSKNLRSDRLRQRVAMKQPLIADDLAPAAAKPELPLLLLRLNGKRPAIAKHPIQNGRRRRRRHPTELVNSSPLPKLQLAVPLLDALKQSVLKKHRQLRPPQMPPWP